MKIERHNPAAVHQPGPYTHAVVISGGRLLILAGQVAWDKHGQLVGENDLRLQTQQVFANIGAILATFDADFSNVVKLIMYVVNYAPEKRQEVIDVLVDYIDLDHPPANTLIGVQALARDDLLIEIEATAAIP